MDSDFYINSARDFTIKLPQFTKTFTSSMTVSFAQPTVQKIFTLGKVAFGETNFQELSACVAIIIVFSLAIYLLQSHSNSVSTSGKKDLQATEAPATETIIVTQATKIEVMEVQQETIIEALEIKEKHEGS
jgi:hypothetical protein